MKIQTSVASLLLNAILARKLRTAKTMLGSGDVRIRNALGMNCISGCSNLNVCKTVEEIGERSGGVTC